MPNSIASRERLNFLGSSYVGAAGKVRPLYWEPRGRAYRLSLLGAFRLLAPSGERLELGSMKAMALLALLATAPTGERWRSWLQEKLWGSLESQRAQAGLRRELHRLRKLTVPYGVSLLRADFRVVRLNLAVIDVDIRQNLSLNSAEFLEGLEVVGEDHFEDWLTEMRGNLVSVVQEISDDRHGWGIDF
ncbi:hypothetical protein [Sphingopyxis witflariensis]|uniref:OmpR/PhoB-type domain-containing protein n=1 Tax=Sphingopyxis witflariensis TaxID=173675 RepID=A0A246JYE9_9SPHN|nr:hypothetical protein [Sphingopyxis witflariensis]OWQ98208.1 hypothetical protein CDQ91_06715 [Sphingopyxis witflariensis]